MEQLALLADSLGLPPAALLLLGVGLGCLLAFAGLAAAVADRNPAAARLAAGRRARSMTRQIDGGLLRNPEEELKGLARAFVPTNLNERAKLARDLAQAGYSGRHAVRNYTLIRMALGLVLPGLLLGLVVLGRVPGVSFPLDLHIRLAGMANTQIVQWLGILVGVGYFGPMYWLRSRVTERRLRIEEALPNALDLMQVSLEAGLGFDAAMTRVGNELTRVAPELGWEFLTVQRQVAAGRPRDAALADMALRTGVETVRSFANVVTQSMQFGSSMSEALISYANELRVMRELKAVEMANKLPVKMSGVLAALMMPVLLLITAGPVVIRMIRTFG